jgi:hypothetical protein
MKEQIERRLLGIQAVLMAHHAATAKLPNAAIGDEREVLVREFLEKVFPAPYRFGTGTVTDSMGNVSGQLDVVVEWPFFASFPAPVGTQRLYLAESVAFVIEVKSDLGTEEWKTVEHSVREIRTLLRRWRGHLATANVPIGTEIPAQQQTAAVNLPSTISYIPYVVVSFTGYKTAETLKGRLETIPQEGRPDAVLVIESGAYVSQWQPHISSGAAGLFAFCVDGSYFVRNVLVADPDIEKYI